MPELPEVEVVKQSLNKKIKFQKIKKILVRNRNLRFKVPKKFELFLTNKLIFYSDISSIIASLTPILLKPPSL